MSSAWFLNALLSIASFSTGLKLWSGRTAPTQLTAVALFLLSLASIIGTLHYGFDTDAWRILHANAWRLFSVAGVYMLIYVWLDVAGLLRIQMPLAWAHAADGVLIFLIGYWLDVLSTVQLVIGIIMTLAALSAAVRFWLHGKPGTASVLTGLSILFVFNGWGIGSDLTALTGPLLRVVVFYLNFTIWVLGTALILRQRALNLIGWSLP